MLSDTPAPSSLRKGRQSWTRRFANPNAAEQGRIRFYDIGDYLTREEKLAAISRFTSMGGITREAGWQAITPDEHGDWLTQRDKRFDKFMAMGDKDASGAAALFANYSSGLKSQRDVWCFNASREAAATNMQSMIGFYNAELKRFDAAYPHADRKARDAAVDGFINTDPSKISWSAALKADLAKGKSFAFDEACLTPSLYRPFTRQWLYYSRTFNERVYQMPRLFPMGEVEADNQVIMVKQRQHEGSQFALMTTSIPDLQSDGGTQCFPEHLYEADTGIAGSDRIGSDRIGSDRIGSDQVYPTLTEEQERNLVICTSGGGQKVAFTVLMTNALPSLHMADIDGSQCFPMFLYE